MDKLKTSILFLVTVLTVGFFWAFISENSYKSRATTDQVLIYFATESKNGDTLTLPITMQSDPTQMVSGAQVTVTYDKTKVNFVSTSETSSTCQSLNSDVKINNFPDEGRLSWIKVRTDSQLPGALPFCFASLKFDMIANGEARFEIVPTNSEVIGPGPKTYTVKTNNNSTKTITIGNADLTPGPTTILTPGPTATLTPSTGNVTLNLKLKLQGVVKKPVSGQTTQTVKVKIVDKNGTSANGSGNFTADDNGLWTGSVSVNAVPGSGYKVFVKGPKHLQKRVCAATPTETYPGSYHCDQGGITIAAGQNTFDFSGIYMPVGDLPDQDGIVNSYDTSLIRNNLGKSDSGILGKADLNFDGIVDTQDHSLIISALSVRGDEGE